MSGIRRFVADTLHVELKTLLLLLAALGVVWGFLALASEVGEGETASFDTAVLLMLRNPADPSDPIGPRWLEEAGRDVTAFGGVTFLTFATLAIAFYLWLEGRGRSAILLLVSIGGGRVLSGLLKLYFDRPRPDLVPHGSIVYSTSFPSSHSMMAAITYFTLALVVARVRPRRATKIYLLGLATLLTVAVGISRVYLGVHWPTDVLAGWGAGILWAASTFTVAQWLARRGSVDLAVEAGGAAPLLERGSSQSMRSDGTPDGTGS